MIERETHLSVQRLSTACLRPTEFWPRDIERIRKLADLLVDNPGAELEPILVRPAPHGYDVMNGHYRWLAHLIAGRTTLLALVERPKKS